MPHRGDPCTPAGTGLREAGQQDEGDEGETDFRKRGGGHGRKFGRGR